jgi:hypothetical protein
MGSSSHFARNSLFIYVLNAAPFFFGAHLALHVSNVCRTLVTLRRFDSNRLNKHRNIKYFINSYTQHIGQYYNR